MGRLISIHTISLHSSLVCSEVVVSVSVVLAMNTLRHLHLGFGILDCPNTALCLLCNRVTLDACASEKDTDWGLNVCLYDLHFWELLCTLRDHKFIL